MNKYLSSITIVYKYNKLFGHCYLFETVENDFNVDVITKCLINVFGLRYHKLVFLI